MGQRKDPMQKYRQRLPFIEPLLYEFIPRSKKIEKFQHPCMYSPFLPSLIIADEFVDCHMLFVIFQDSGITSPELSPLLISPPKTPCRCPWCGMICNVSPLPQDCELLKAEHLSFSSSDPLCLAQCLTREKCPSSPLLSE